MILRFPGLIGHNAKRVRVDDFAGFCLTIDLILHFLAIKHPNGDDQVAMLVKMATKKMMTSVSGIAHFLAVFDSVTTDMTDYPCCKAKRLSMRRRE
ncbi:Uncharacterised protein [Salmonella enterica subsp. enterica serovar Sanjuan]|uniref:Uncharacterized protein n=1 Tax=Salmonella enterica subsp. enterica serovar Sanjuan TaxID=1160765 RepID=A0A3S4F746_SALET|nr:Uncharacterised protein [Salmonella enterica subsp. enterica serovar Sanjuan]